MPSLAGRALPIGTDPFILPPFMPALDEELGRALAELEAAGLLRRVPRVIVGAQGPVVRIDGRAVLCFSSNDYLGLAGHPRLVAAARAALAEEGLGAGASRLITGTMRAHRDAEARLARFVDAPASLLFASGYAANVGTLSCLLERGDVVFSDALNHASLIDGCRLSHAEVHVYPHGDMEALADMLARHRPGARRALVVTDGVFSMDGERAPLPALRAVCDARDAWLLVDEAHSLGVLGPGGRGAAAEAGVRPEILVGTLGKAFGVVGAFVAGSVPLVRYLENRARSYVFSTAPPPALAAAAALSTDLVAEAGEGRRRVIAHADRLRTGLSAQGWDARGDGTPIVPVHIGSAAETMRLSGALFERGFLAQGIRPPTVAEGTSRIRLVPTAAHSAAQIEDLLEAFRRLRPGTPP